MLGTSKKDGKQKHFLLVWHPTQSGVLPSWPSCLQEQERWHKYCCCLELGSEDSHLHRQNKSELS